MFLAEILDQLTYGELSQLSMSGFESNVGIQPCDYDKIIPHINLGLIDLHKRFDLRSSVVALEQFSQITSYVLESKYSVNAAVSTEPVRYILDTPENPFVNNILHIEKILDSEDKVLFLNDDTENESIFTTAYNTLHFKTPIDTTITYTHYRAAPDKILIPGLDPTTQEIAIPDSLLEPLLFFIASRAYGVLNLDNNAESNNYLSKYENSINNIRKYNLINEDDSANQRLDSRNWV